MHYRILGHCGQVVGYCLDVSKLGDDIFRVLDWTEGQFVETDVVQQGGYVYVLSAVSLLHQSEIEFRPALAPVSVGERRTTDSQVILGPNGEHVGYVADKDTGRLTGAAEKVVEQAVSYLGDAAVHETANVVYVLDEVAVGAAEEVTFKYL